MSKSDPRNGFRFERYVYGYGWNVLLFLNGKHRARWSSTKATTRMWPHLYRGADENCNRSITVHLWPMGSLDIWWETAWRPEGSGPCNDCLLQTRV